ncbi:MAG TPA: hypothetical protein VLW65_19300 [Bryobacteraceae bacterium]|nr:hypothetical protein [Bryobacteraceae bacterium]
MNEHLDSQTLERHIAGERTPEAENHLRECAACRAAVSRMEAALAQFALSTRRWSESQALSRPPAGWLASARPRRRMAPARWAAVAATAAVLLAVPLYYNYSQRQAAAQARADAVLLEEVSTDISRPAPEPLEPLIELVSQSNTGENR